MKLAGPDDGFVEPVYTPGDAGPPDRHPNSVILGDPETRRMYEITMEAGDLEKIGRAFRASGLDRPTVTDKPSGDDAPVNKGWSGGLDNRTPRGASAYAQNTWPYTTIGQLKKNGFGSTTIGHCGATFVGSAGTANVRYILTAAHCLWDETTGAYLDPDFWPRQDSCLAPSGNGTVAVPGCIPGPYGEWDGGQWQIPSYFVTNCAGQVPMPAACWQHDIAIIRVTRQSGASFPGALGFGYFSPGDLQLTAFKYHRGYPNCGGPGDPVPTTSCLPATLYGDEAFTMDSGSFYDGAWPRVYAFSGDSSGGHSGGPLYFNSGGHFVFGVMSNGICTGSACTGTLVSNTRAITATWYNGMTSFMSQ